MNLLWNPGLGFTVAAGGILSKTKVQDRVRRKGKLPKAMVPCVVPPAMQVHAGVACWNK